MDKIGEVQARFAIEELFARYAHTIDNYDAAGWVVVSLPMVCLKSLVRMSKV